MGHLSAAKQQRRARVRERRLAELRQERQAERLDADKRRLAADAAGRPLAEEVSSAPRSPGSTFNNHGR